MKKVVQQYFSWIPVLIVLFSAAFYAFSWIQMYFMPHTYEAASEWIFENVPKNSRILGVHWDDKLPIHLPDKVPSQYGYIYEGDSSDLKLYELPDNERKMGEVAGQLAQSDYIIFPTGRLPGSIPRKPGEYPLSTRFFQLLFSENLGFHLEKTFKIRPGMFGLEFNDDLADESLSVYDHPKAFIFRNVGRLTRQELLQKILSADFQGELPSLEAMLSRNAGNSGEQDSTYDSGILEGLIWLLTLEILAFAVQPWFSWCCKGLPDHALGLSKVTGFLALGLVSWLLTSFGIFPFTQSFLVILFISLVALGFSLRRFQPCLRSLRSHVINTETLFIGSFIFFAFIRMLNPEIFWGEKPMELTFFNYFSRITELPPEDPWAAGQVMHYYYLGFYLFVSVAKLLGISSGIAFNLALASIGAFIVSALYSLFVFITRSQAFSAAASLLVTLVSNFEVFRIWFFEKKSPTFDNTFWPSSRVFASPAFSEYTQWSLLFADLHAHVIAIPVTILFLTLTILISVSDQKRYTQRGLFLRVCAGIVFGTLFAANTWDFISFGFVGGILVLFSIITPFWQAPERKSFLGNIAEKIFSHGFARLVALLWDGGAMISGTLLVALPFWLYSGNTESPGFNWVQPIELNALSQILRFLNPWPAIMAVSLVGVLFLPKDQKNTFRLSSLSIGILLALSLVALRALGGLNPVFTDQAHTAKNFGWDIVFFAAILIFFSTVLLSFVSRVKPEFHILLVLAASSIFFLVITELFFLLDRMNTIFKFYNGLWMLFGVCSLGLLGALIHHSRTRWLNTGLLSFALLALISSFVGSILNFIAILKVERVPGNEFTLDGEAYLKAYDPNELRLFNWINDNISGTPVVLEAHGDGYQYPEILSQGKRRSYGPVSRVTMHTGLPTVLGWPHHVKQRGLRREIEQMRARDIESIYTTTDFELTQELLLKYGVELLVVSDIERTIYGTTGLSKFEQDSFAFPVLFRSGGVVLYATPFSRFHPLKNVFLKKARL